MLRKICSTYKSLLKSSGRETWDLEWQEWFVSTEISVENRNLVVKKENIPTDTEVGLEIKMHRFQS